MIAVDSVTKYYGDFAAVSEVSFSVEEGRIVGFLGPNGAGKTTTMKIITGFMPATRGTVKIDGFDVFEQPTEVKRRIGYLPEQPPLYSDMVVDDFLEFAARLRDVDPKNTRPAVDRAVEDAGLQDVRGRIIAHLSKGYRQRVGIAQALVHSPRVLVLDEPTVGLDPAQIREIRDLIRKLSGNRTIILSTHILPEVSALCERIIIIHQGKIVADGTEEDLWKSVTGAERLFLAVEGELERITAVLEKMDEVDALEIHSSRDRTHRLYITATPGGDPRGRLSLALASINCPVLEMRPPGLTLEEVFISLTSGEKGNQ